MVNKQAGSDAVRPDLVFSKAHVYQVRLRGNVMVNKQASSGTVRPDLVSNTAPVYQVRLR